MLAEINALAGEDLGIDSRLGKLQAMGKISQPITGADEPKTQDGLVKNGSEVDETLAR